MKKYLLTLLVITFVVPSIAFASCWNPFSWNWKALFTSPAKEEVHIEKQTPEIKPVDKPTTIIPSIKEIKKDVPIIDNSIAQKKEAQVKLEAELKLKAEQDALILKQKTLEQAGVEKGKEAPFVKLSIDNITITDITDSSVNISWETSKISESKVLLDGKEYIPINGVGTNHYVVINGLKNNLFYTGSVTAISNSSWENKIFEFTTAQKDWCSNISGIQASLPSGMIFDGEKCITTPSSNCFIISGGKKVPSFCGASA
jgi:hypothetical protein